jgi:hypothetical protein
MSTNHIIGKFPDTTVCFDIRMPLPTPMMEHTFAQGEIKAVLKERQSHQLACEIKRRRDVDTNVANAFACFSKMMDAAFPAPQPASAG